MIEFQDVTKIYGNGTVGLDHVNLTVGDGEFLAVIGLSGAGKSTLLRCVNRLIDVTQGEINVDGLSITRADRRQLRRMRTRIGMISQTFNLVKRNTVQRNVLSGKLGSYSTFKSVFGLFNQADYDLCSAMLAKVGLENKLHTRCDELSGGQQQRVSIARTLFQEADIILADEPVASLDPVTSQAIMDDLHRINTEMHKTILINIHSVPLARQYASRIIGMRAGKIVFDGTADDLTEEQLQKIYQGERE